MTTHGLTISAAPQPHSVYSPSKPHPLAGPRLHPAHRPFRVAANTSPTPDFPLAPPPAKA